MSQYGITKMIKPSLVVVLLKAVEVLLPCGRWAGFSISETASLLMDGAENKKTLSNLDNHYLQRW